jgi:hypothetical protein
MKLDRRQFIKGAALTGALAASAGVLTACDPSAPAGQNNAAPGDGVEGANPQEAAPVSGYISNTNWLGEPPSIADGDIAEEIACDVLVIGGGHSGIQAALAAAEGGAKVAVVEKSSEADRWCSGEDFGAPNSHFVIDFGYGPYDDGEIITEIVNRNQGRVDAEIISKYVHNVGETFDHMVGLVEWPNSRIVTSILNDPSKSPIDADQINIHTSGMEIDGPIEWPMIRGGFKTWAATVQFCGSVLHEAVSSSTSDFGRDMFTWRIDEVQQFSLFKSQDLGAQWFFGELAQVLVQDAGGAVVGAITQRADGAYVKYNASNGVILCAGDYASNSDMIWNLNTELAEYAGRTGGNPDSVRGMSASTGDGQKMGCWVGGMMQPSPRGAMTFGGGGGGPWGLAPFLWLNANGMRYMNEAWSPLVWAESLKQPDGIITSVGDANWFEIVKQSSVDHTAPVYGRPVYYDELKEDMAAIPVGDPAGGQVRDCTLHERRPYQVFAADTIEEALSFAGYDSNAVRNAIEQINRYNELCHAGTDKDFGKDACFMIPIEQPPFYTAPKEYAKGGAINVGLVTLAGLVTNSDFQVVDENSMPIPGLYAAGNCLGGRFGANYVTPYAGISISMAATTGRMAGKVITGQTLYKGNYLDG